MTSQHYIIESISDSSISGDTVVKSTIGEIRSLLLSVLEPTLVKSVSTARKADEGVHLYPGNQQPPSPNNPINASWSWFLMEVQIAQLVNSLVVVECVAATTVVPSLLFPGLLIVKLLSVLDDALSHYIIEMCLKSPTNTKKLSLHNKLEYLDQTTGL